jgi:hypothetical protein
MLGLFGSCVGQGLVTYFPQIIASTSLWGAPFVPPLIVFISHHAAIPRVSCGWTLRLIEPEEGG